MLIRTAAASCTRANPIELFRSQESGAIAIVFSITSLVMIGITALAVDYVTWSTTKARLQATADAASIAGAQTLGARIANGSSGAMGDAEAVARAYVATRYGSLVKASVVVNPTSQTVGVDLSRTDLQFFSQVIGVSAPEIGASAAAKVRGTSKPACIIALDPASAVGIDFGLAGSMTANGCAIWSNSTSATSINANGSGTVSASTTCAVGNIQRFGISFVPEVEQQCAPVVDPLAQWSPPTKPVTCSKNSLIYESAGITNLTPGVYCGGLRANGNMRIVMAPGLYVFTDGPLIVSGGASIEGTGVSLWFTGPNAYLDLAGSAEVSLSAPTSGSFAGLVIASGRTEPWQTFRIRGNSSLYLQGSVYLPTHHLDYSGSPDAILPPDFTVLIAATIGFSGSSTLVVRTNFTGAGMPAYTAPTPIGLGAALVQ